MCVDLTFIFFLSPWIRIRRIRILKAPESGFETLVLETPFWGVAIRFATIESKERQEIEAEFNWVCSAHSVVVCLYKRSSEITIG